MKPIKDKEWILEHLHDKKLRLIDCRFSLSDPVAGRNSYERGHIPGAVFFDLEEDLSSSVTTHGGRHPLPEIDILKDKLEHAGIADDTIVVAYDDGEGAFAGRFWWLLTYLGHEHCYLLDGGFKEWMQAQYPIDADLPGFTKTELSIDLQSSIVATYDEVKEIVRNGGATLIDSRAENRYLGKEEPIDKRAGHIPGAVNKVWTHTLENGRWKSLEEQKQRFQDLDRTKPVVVYCGSGVTATPNFLALREAGFDVRLYAGSYSDWVSYDENEVETNRS